MTHLLRLVKTFETLIPMLPDLHQHPICRQLGSRSKSRQLTPLEHAHRRRILLIIPLVLPQGRFLRTCARSLSLIPISRQHRLWIFRRFVALSRRLMRHSNVHGLHGVKRK